MHFLVDFSRIYIVQKWWRHKNNTLLECLYIRLKYIYIYILYIWKSIFVLMIRNTPRSSFKVSGFAFRIWTESRIGSFVIMQRELASTKMTGKLSIVVKLTIGSDLLYFYFYFLHDDWPYFFSGLDRIERWRADRKHFN